MNLRQLPRYLVGAAGLIVFAPAQASLQARDLTGNNIADAYYDTALGITWLKDANLIKSNNFGVPYSTYLGTHPLDGYYAPNNEINGTYGFGDWGAVMYWLDAMNDGGYLGYSGWRLPTTIDTGSVGCNWSFGGTDCGYNVQTADGSGSYSELAYMFYVNLGNKGAYDTSGTPQAGAGLVDDPADPNDDNLFPTLVWGQYWSSSLTYPDAGKAWVFDMGSGRQDVHGKANDFYAWVVHSGDIGTPISSVPLPSAWTLLLAAMAPLGSAVRRQHGGSARAQR